MRLVDRVIKAGRHEFEENRRRMNGMQYAKNLATTRLTKAYRRLSLLVKETA